MSLARVLALVALLSAPLAPAKAQDAAEPDFDGAKAVLAKWLDAVKAKKWADAKKVTHPKAIEAIADVKKRTQVENHPLAPWARLSESYLTKYEITDARASALGAVVVRTSEEHFSVEEKGVEEGAPAEYLLVPVAGAWWLTDRRVGENVYDQKTVAASFKGYFEGEFEMPAAPPPKKRKGK